MFKNKYSIAILFRDKRVRIQEILSTCKSRKQIELEYVYLRAICKLENWTRILQSYFPSWFIESSDEIKPKMEYC